jgi:ribosomal protein L29
MAVLKFKEIKSMDKKSRESKLKELKMELIKANVSANKTNAKTKEIKKAIARILTLNTEEKSRSKEVLNNK